MIRLPFRFNSNKTPSKFLTVDIGSDAIKVMAFEIETTEDSTLASIIGVVNQI